MGVRPARAVGDRSVSVAGDVVGSLIVTGNNNNLNLLVGPEHGALLEQLARAKAPRQQLRPGPLRSVPAELPGRLDREGEAHAILEAAAARESVNLHGERGIGKTYALLEALNADHPALASGAVYLYSDGPLEDLLQQLFEAFYECGPPFKPSTNQLREYLASARGIVVLDSVSLERDAAQQLITALPGCQLVVASRQRVLWGEAKAVAIVGLEPKFALQMIERELGRPLAEAEREAGERICEAFAGHPLKILEAVASGRDANHTLATIASALSQANPDAVIAHDKLQAAGANGRQLLAALALLSDATVGEAHLRAIAGLDQFEPVLRQEMRRMDIRAQSPRYSLGATLASATESLELEPAGDRAVAHFTDWAVKHRAEPAVLLTEASALLTLLRWAVSSGRAQEAIRLGRAIDPAFPLGRRFGAWREVLELVLHAARDTGDREAEGWALHQLGTRLICLADLAAGTAMLDEAIALRRKLGDEQGALLSVHNRAVAARSRSVLGWIRTHWVLLVIMVLALAGGLLAAILPSTRGRSPRTSTASSTGSSSSSPRTSTASSTGSSSSSPRTSTASSTRSSSSSPRTSTASSTRSSSSSTGSSVTGVPVFPRGSSTGSSSSSTTP